MKQIEVFTDGACRGNPGPGGWGAILRYAGKEREIYGGEALTTNNRMEMTAVLSALNALNEPCHVVLTTDSEYVLKGMTEWLAGWKARNWKTASRQPVKNADLWQQLEQAASRHTIDWRWVRGHTGHPENERADALANLGIDQLIKV